MAKKLESTLTNMSLSLFLICAVMAAALGYVYALTKEPIELAEKEKINQAIQKVIPKFNNNPGIEAITIDDIILYPAKMNGKLIGIAVKSSSYKGFSGEVTIMVGFNPDGSIINTEVMQQNETPGLGTKMKEPKFRNQFIGKTPTVFKVSVIKDGGDVNAITAATISSRAFCDAVQKAYDVFISKYPLLNTKNKKIEGGIK